jgi:hypothetical protein
VQDLWDTIKGPIIGIKEGEKVHAKSTESIFNKIITENFPNLEKREGHPGTRSEKKYPSTYYK